MYDLETIAIAWNESFKVPEPQRARLPIVQIIAQARRCAETFHERTGLGDPGYLPGLARIFVPDNGFEYRLAMVGVDPAIFGGDLLVALPNWHVSTALSTGTMHVPDYLHEKFKLGYEHCVPLAVFLTAFDDELTRLRG